MNLPFILFTALYPESFYKSILEACSTNLNDAFLKYTVVQSIAFVSLILGIYTYSRFTRNSIKEPDSFKILYNYKNIKRLGLSLLVVAISGYSFFIIRIGGFGYLFTHLHNRVELQSGQYYLIALNFLYFVPLFLMLCIKLKNKVSDKVLLILSIVLISFIFSSFGARKNTLILLILVVVSYHYTLKKITFKGVNKTFLLIAVVALSLYILAIPIVRRKDALAKIESKEINYEKALSVKTLLYNVSYTFIDVFAANYFNEENAWHLKGLSDPVKVFLFKGDKSEAPPVDQGVYFWNIVKYKKDFSPSIPRGKMHKNSWPIENFGFGYANFLLPGVIVAFYLQGLIFALVYGFLKKEVVNPALQFMYVFVVFNFNFSNLRLSQLAATLPIALVCYVLFYIVTNHKKSNRLL
ncbi:hypothetical protein GR160_12080 [Flavobacterium sp. Sd200]|uniref:hypothetical protein n=1 Tax=Flavobacterium sp. Sd200 TaxID=2692211 RepID=UPI00137053C6|nr:hypothetical protein [Flavobacterium sp. Sd200]MXN91963.1 hypothetical protein [Flavobacterium sp. Sd200]